MPACADVIWAVVPIKDFSRAKGRLARCLDPAARARLAHAMAEDVMAALQGSQVADRLCVLSDSPLSREIATRSGALWIDERHLMAAPGLNGAVTASARLAAEGGATALLVTHADLPLLTAAEIEQVVRTWRALPGQQRVVLVRSRDGGTNLLLVERPEVFDYHYGPASHARHVEACVQRQRVTASVVLVGGALDIDTAGDFERLVLASRDGLCGRHTTAALAEIQYPLRPNLMEFAS